MTSEMTGIHLADVVWQPIQAQYEEADVLRAGVECSLIAEDSETGGTALFVKAPPGWTGDLPESHSVTQIVVLLQGDYCLGDFEFKPGSVLHIPPGRVHGPGRTQAGFVAYTYNAGSPDATFHPDKRHGDIA
jgi:hypothetical protein